MHNCTKILYDFLLLSINQFIDDKLLIKNWGNYADGFPADALALLINQKTKIHPVSVTSKPITKESGAYSSHTNCFPFPSFNPMKPRLAL